MSDYIANRNPEIADTTISESVLTTVIRLMFATPLFNYPSSLHFLCTSVIREVKRVYFECCKTV